VAGVFLRQGDDLVAMVETPYEAEAVLQELLAKHPALLSGDDPARVDWLLVRREASVVFGDLGGSRGSLDHVFVDEAGVPTLVEVKRSDDSRIRREAVAQMLDYASNAASHWKNDTLRDWFVEQCANSGQDPDARLRAAFGEVDVDAYWETVRTNVAAEKFRLVFVADTIPSELRRIVEYLNGQMTETEVLAIEVKMFRDTSGRHETLVPRLIGRTEAAIRVKGRGDKAQWTRAAIIREIEERGDPAAVEVVHRLFAWVDERGDLSEWFGTGPFVAYQAGFPPPLEIWPFNLSVYGWISVQAVDLVQRPAFASESMLNGLLRHLNNIPGVDLTGDSLKRPKIYPDVLALPGNMDLFIDAMNWVYDNRTGTA
jgi:hypothetical protein